MTMAEAWQHLRANTLLYPIPFRKKVYRLAADIKIRRTTVECSQVRRILVEAGYTINETITPPAFASQSSGN